MQCDEVWPECSFCSTRVIRCTYPSPRSDDSTVVSSSSSVSCEPAFDNFPVEDTGEELALSPLYSYSLPQILSKELSPTDLRVMHHVSTILMLRSVVLLQSYSQYSCSTLLILDQWSTFTWSTVGLSETPMNKVLQFVVPELAFETSFLMNAMLGIASLHMQQLLPDPTQSQKQTMIYRARALKQYRQALPLMDTNSDQYDAALIMALLLVVLCSQDYIADNEELIVVKWIFLYGGMQTVMKLGDIETIPSRKVGPIFNRYITEVKLTPTIPSSLLNMVACITPLDPDYAYLEFYCKTLDDLAVVYASLVQDGLGNALSLRVITWPTYVSTEFANLAKEKHPRALIILAHYLVFTKLVSHLWWVDGVADRDISIIARGISPEWLSFLKMPLEAISLTKAEDIVQLLLRQ